MQLCEVETCYHGPQFGCTPGLFAGAEVAHGHQAKSSPISSSVARKRGQIGVKLLRGRDAADVAPRGLKGASKVLPATSSQQTIGVRGRVCTCCSVCTLPFRRGKKLFSAHFEVSGFSTFRSFAVNPFF